jgi:hypothetical protein
MFIPRSPLDEELCDPAVTGFVHSVKRVLPTRRPSCHRAVCHWEGEVDRANPSPAALKLSPGPTMDKPP